MAWARASGHSGVLRLSRVYPRATCAHFYLVVHIGPVTNYCLGIRRRRWPGQPATQVSSHVSVSVSNRGSPPFLAQSRRSGCRPSRVTRSALARAIFPPLDTEVPGRMTRFAAPASLAVAADSQVQRASRTLKAAWKLSSDRPRCPRC